MIAGIQSRIAALSKGENLPKNLDEAKPESAMNGLDEVSKGLRETVTPFFSPILSDCARSVPAIRLHRYFQMFVRPRGERLRRVCRNCEDSCNGLRLTRRDGKGQGRRRSATRMQPSSGTQRREE